MTHTNCAWLAATENRCMCWLWGTSSEPHFLLRHAETAETDAESIQQEECSALQSRRTWCPTTEVHCHQLQANEHQYIQSVLIPTYVLFMFVWTANPIPAQTQPSIYICVSTAYKQSCTCMLWRLCKWSFCQHVSPKNVTSASQMLRSLLKNLHIQDLAHKFTQGYQKRHGSVDHIRLHVVAVTMALTCFVWKIRQVIGVAVRNVIMKSVTLWEKKCKG